MKTLTYLILIIACVAFGCAGPVKEEKKSIALARPVSRGQKYSIDTKQSVLIWEGSMVLTSGKNSGYVYISKGGLMIENGQLVGGTVEIDMNTIGNKDSQDKEGPIDHLKSADYFDVGKFPISTFAITKVVTVRGDKIQVTGNLTIKGITKPITFPARIEIKDGMAEANGKVVIDRTQWGIRYASGKFYDNLADEAVSDDIGIDMKIVAKK